MSLLATQFLLCAVQAASDGVATGRLAASGRILAKTRNDLVLGLARQGGGDSRYGKLNTSDLGGRDEVRLCFSLMYMWETVNARPMLSALRRRFARDDDGAVEAADSLRRFFFAGYCDGFLGRGGSGSSVFDKLSSEVDRFAGAGSAQVRAA